MNKEQFMAQMKDALNGIPEDKKQDILYDYEEHFSIGLSEGKTEEEIAQSLGNPRTIGNSYRIDAMLSVPKDRENVSASSVVAAVLASLSLTFLNVVFVLGPLLGLFSLLFALWVTAEAIAFSGVVIMISPVSPDIPRMISSPALNSVFLVLSGVGVTALGVLSNIGMWFLTKWFFIGVAAYVKFNARIIRGAK